MTDYFSKKPLDAVTVQTSSGSHSISDSTGKYSITVNKKDSIWFSYLNKQTMKYSVDTIAHPQSFDVALYVDVRWLPEVKVATKNYKLDSLQNRQNRQALAFQQRLIQQEHDKYIDHRYTKYLIKKLTHLDGKLLENFMNYYRPSYDEVLLMNDLELGYYIEQCYKNYHSGK